MNRVHRGDHFIFSALHHTAKLQKLFAVHVLCSVILPETFVFCFLDQKWQDGEGESAVVAEEPPVPGALRLSHPLQHIPTSREEKLLAALLCSLDGTGTPFSLPDFLLPLQFTLSIWKFLMKRTKNGADRNDMTTKWTQTQEIILS